MNVTENTKLGCIHHIVHDYANFISSGKMVIDGSHLERRFEAPVNTHLAHAFLLNCRKMAEFFGGHPQKDDVVAQFYLPSFKVSLRNCDDWREAMHKQLAHITFTRLTNPKEIPAQGISDMYIELKEAWKDFRGGLPEPFSARFAERIKSKSKESGFEDLDL